MISWCGTCWPCRPFSLSCMRCWTPKRCCSSTITSARRWNVTPSWNSAWVPTAMCTSPLATAAMALRRVRAGCEPESSATVMPSGRNQASSVRQCCSASSSVGAISAAWPPLPTARAAAAAAITVLPQPTSPWINRIIGSWRCRSLLDLTKYTRLRGSQRKRQGRDEAVH